MPAKDVKDARRAAQKETSEAVRVVADWRKAVNYHPKTVGVRRLDQYVETEVDYTARQKCDALSANIYKARIKR